MIKKLIIVILILVPLLVIGTTTYAATTIFWVKSVGGEETIGSVPSSYSGNVDTNIISIAYIKKIEVMFDYEVGDINLNSSDFSVNYWNFQAGYPLVQAKKGMIDITAGLLNNSQNFYYDTKIEAAGSLLGIDILFTPNELFSLEANLQQSVNGSYKSYRVDKDNYGFNSPMFLTVYKIKLQFNLSDNLGLVLFYHGMNNTTQDTTSLTQNENTTAIGLIYKF